jgi:hypothetical protein
MKRKVGYRVAFCLLFLSQFALGQPYTINQIPASSEPMGGTYVLMPDDAVSPQLSIGFTFCYWGNSYTSFYIGTNGWVGFSAGQPIAFTPFAIPTLNALVPKNCIMSPFHDLHPGQPSQLNYISYYTSGIAPFRRLVVSWDNVPMYQCTASRSTQQIVIYETTNIIRTNIIVKRTCLVWVNGFAIHGLHNINGTQAVIVLGRNATVWGSPWLGAESWTFTPTSCQCPINYGVLNIY